MSIKNIKPGSNNFKYSQGYYKPINENKYVGPKPIIYRSSWEQKFCVYCDKSEEIIKWSSEPIKIKYYNPLNKKYHHYYPDFYIKIKASDGNIKEYLVEIKPKNHIKKPDPPKRKTKKSVKNYKYAVNTYIKNLYKSRAAKKLANNRGMEYIIITEDSLK